MSKKVYRKINRKPSHAGRILKTGFIDTHQLRIETVADLLGVSRVHLSRIINGHSPITLDLAHRLAMLTQTTASQWLTIQAKYDAYQMAQQQSFRQYKEALNLWTANALTQHPEERRSDEATNQLTGEVAALAKQLKSRQRARS